MALILKDVSIAIADRQLIRPFSLGIAPGEILTLMGPSGSGKSSLLSLIAGDLEAPFSPSGEIWLGGRNLTKLAPEVRGIGRLFQDDLLFPHMTVGENLLFGMPRGAAAGRQQAMREALRRVDLEGFADRPPHTLSGGQRSRVALMRALLANPRAMLLDEPFNKLDQDLRDAMRHLVFNHLRERAIPCLLVSHDRADAPAGARILTLSQQGDIQND
ncbi:MAG: ATP-binding cassette domain-containing protein [Alphaproteobacteria bacterium]|nr:ATP-binding cassette domain-containing protein [Alphaproteobacteria bacterium]